LTWLTLALNFLMGGLRPGGYHALNLLLHVLNTGLIYLLARRLTRENQPKPGAPNQGGGKFAEFTAFLTALMFGLHPLHVESVAWASERKDVLSAFFYLLALFLYMGYVSMPRRKGLFYSGSLLAFALSLMSKPMAVSLPLVLLTLDVWPSKRFRWNAAPLWIEKIPFFALGAMGAITAYLAQSSARAVASFDLYSVDLRILNAFRYLVFYPWKMIFPVGLSPLYPISPQWTLDDNLECGFGILVTTAVVVVSFLFRKGAPYLGVAGLAYLAALAPVLGIFQVGSQAAADRYAYLPSLPLFMLVAAWVASQWKRSSPIFFMLCLLLSLAMGYVTLRQIHVWTDSKTLWERVVGLYPGQSVTAHTNLGTVYQGEGRYGEALAQFQMAAAIPPPSAVTHNGIAAAYFFMGKMAEAQREFEAAASLDPRYASPHRNLWYIHKSRGEWKEALAEIQKAVELAPDNPDFNQCLGETLDHLGQAGQAQVYLRRAEDLRMGILR